MSGVVAQMAEVLRVQAEHQRKAMDHARRGYRILEESAGNLRAADGWAQLAMGMECQIKGQDEILKLGLSLAEFSQKFDQKFGGGLGE